MYSTWIKLRQPSDDEKLHNQESRYRHQIPNGMLQSKSSSLESKKGNQTVFLTAIKNIIIEITHMTEWKK